MYLRVVQRENRDGTVVRYLQMVESTWDRSKQRSRPRILHSFGRVTDQSEAKLVGFAQSVLKRLDPLRAARLSGPESESEPAAPSTPTRPFGAVFVLGHLWRELGLDQLLLDRFAETAREPHTLERATFAMVAYLAMHSRSKLHCWDVWLSEQVHIPGTGDLVRQRLYDAMDAFEKHELEVQRCVFDALIAGRNADCELVFYYDTTSTYWEIELEDEGREWTRPPKDPEPLRMRGHSKDHRPDAPQVVIGMAVTRDGFPVRSWVFPGNTVDVTTIEQVKRDLNAWGLRRCVIVGDRGMTSVETMRTLAGGGGGYILGVPMRRGEQVVREVLSRPGRYKTVRENLQVKEVWHPSRRGARAKRFVIALNPEQAKRHQTQREQLLEQLEAELRQLHSRPSDRRTTRIHELMAHRSYKRYLKEVSGQRLRIDRAAVRAESRLDGKYLLTTTDETLSAEDLALGYKNLQRVEECWQMLKSGLDVHPVRHYAPRRIRSHLHLSQLALTLTRIVEHRTGMTWPTARLMLDRVHSARVGDGLLGTTPPPARTVELLAKVGVPKIPRLMPFSGTEGPGTRGES